MGTDSPVGIVGLLDTSRTKTKSLGQSINPNASCEWYSKFLYDEDVFAQIIGQHTNTNLNILDGMKANRFSEVVSVNNLPPKNKKPG
jgi:hypothetical protein